MSNFYSIVLVQFVALELKLEVSGGGASKSEGVNRFSYSVLTKKKKSFSDSRNYELRRIDIFSEYPQKL